MFARNNLAALSYQISCATPFTEINIYLPPARLSSPKLFYSCTCTKERRDKFTTATMFPTNLQEPTRLTMWPTMWLIGFQEVHYSFSAKCRVQITKPCWSKPKYVRVTRKNIHLRIMGCEDGKPSGLCHWGEGGETERLPFRSERVGGRKNRSCGESSSRAPAGMDRTH